MEVTTLYADSFEDTLEGFDGLSVVKFYAPWCRTCRMIAPIYKKLSDQMEKEAPGRVRFYEIDFKQAKDLCLRERVLALPTVSFYTSGLGKVNSFCVTAAKVNSKLTEELRRYLGDETTGHLSLLQSLRSTSLGPLVKYVKLVEVMQALENAPEYGSEAEEVGAMVGKAVGTQERLAELNELFNSLDVNSDGVLDVEEIQAVANVVGSVGESGVAELLQGAVPPAVSLDDGFVLTRAAFVDLMTARAKVEFSKPKTELLPAFQALDLDGDGVITREEMLEVMGRLNLDSSRTRDAAASIFDALDVDKSDSLDYEEFVAMMSGARLEEVEAA